MNDTAPATRSYQPVTRRAEILERIRRSEADVRALHATGLYIYGPAAEDQLASDTDIDVFIDYNRDGSFSFVELIRLEELLVAMLGRNVDFTTRDGLERREHARIEATSLRVL